MSCIYSLSLYSNILINYWYGGLTASDGARLHQKRLIIGSSSSGAAPSGDWAHNTLGSGWLQWRWCGGVGHRDMC